MMLVFILILAVALIVCFLADYLINKNRETAKPETGEEPELDEEPQPRANLKCLGWGNVWLRPEYYDEMTRDENER